VYTLLDTYVTLPLTAWLADEGWLTVVVFKDLIAMAGRFWPSDLQARAGLKVANSKDGVEGIYFVRQDYVCEFVDELAGKYGLKKSKTVEDWCETYKKGRTAEGGG